MDGHRPTGIRDKIIEKTFKQCLKLLDPGCREFRTQRGSGHISEPLPPRDQQMLSATGGRHVCYVQTGAFPLRDYTGLTQLPAIYIIDGSDGSASSHDTSSRNRRLGESVLQKTFEVYPLTLRVVVHQKVNPTYAESNPVQLAQIREQLDYLLDMQTFKGITDKRLGYNLPSVVEYALITDGESLKGIATPWEIKDFEFEVIFTRQLARNS